ncbi:MAG TPA: glycoside hydrolase family 31 protein, partial [Acidimicrobiales bacterium]|nr:glycoside hydrolase family 31 protein [Acidimicrobiales bacterium]
MKIAQKMQLTTIAVLASERWWGGAVVDADLMPLRPGYARDLHDLGGNQGASMLLSSLGRYVFSPAPFTVTVADADLVIEGAAPVVVRGGSRGLGGARHAAFTEEARPFAARNYGPIERPIDPRLITAPQYNLWIEQLYEPTQEGALAYAQDAIAAGFPPGVLMIDARWHEEFGVWQFHSGRFPDPAAMVKTLKDLGFATMLWVAPFVTSDTPTFRLLRDRGLLVMNPDGKPAIGEWWDGWSAALDLRNPQAVEWFVGQLDGLCERYKVDGFKFDGGDAAFYGRMGVQEAERSTMTWTNIGLRYPLAEYRESWNAFGLPLAQRQQDTRHSWGRGGLASLIPRALVQGLLGYPYNCADMVGGGEYRDFLASVEGGTFDAELFVRHAQLSSLLPMMQFSAAPWRMLNGEKLALVRDAAQRFVELGPVRSALAAEAFRTGEPLVRHLASAYPG